MPIISVTDNANNRWKRTSKKKQKQREKRGDALRRAEAIVKR